MDGNDIERKPEELFFLEHFNTDAIFRRLKRADYALLYSIDAHAGARGRPGRAYLSDLSKALGIPIPSLSRTMERLQDRGFVVWKTDRTAGQTYVKLTGKAVELMEDEHVKMARAYERIMTEIDRGELERAMETVKKITDILKEAGDA